MSLSPQCQQNRRSSLRLKWECWMEEGGSTLSSRKNPSKASMNTCLPSSLICVTGEPCLTLISNFGGTVSKFKNDLWDFCFLRVKPWDKMRVLKFWLIVDDITVSLWYHRETGNIWWNVWLLLSFAEVFLVFGDPGSNCVSWQFLFFSSYVNAVSV